MKKKKSGWKRGLMIFLCLILFLIAGGGTVLAIVVSRSPSLDSVDFTPSGYLTTVVDDQGEVITSLAGNEANRVYTDLDMIPEDLQHAFVAIEDSRFYTHHGIDPKGILRAFVKGILSGGKFSEGASTITQQLLKNNVFTQWTSEDTMQDRLTRKVQEQWVALQLERKISKEEILENYLNTINLGAGTWGVQQASRRYFNKDVSALNLAECSVIAGITKNPSAYNPIQNPEKCQERQKLVLAAMLKQGYITEDEYNFALADDVYTRIAKNHTDGSAEVFSYFEDALVEQILKDLMNQMNYTEAQAWDVIYRGGLTIYSTQNSDYQRIVEEEINRSDLYADDKVQASLVLMDVDTGEVKAIAGGRGEKDASLIMNRAVDSIRQPGSLVKVIGEYSAAMEYNMINLGSVIDDEPYTYSDGTKLNNASGEFSGKVTINYAIAESLNIPALKVFQQVGAERVWQMLERYGITTLTDADRVEALAIGGTSGGVTNLEMTAAYNAIANGGTYLKPVYYTKVVDHDGNVILSNSASPQQVISEETAALLTSAMEDVIQDGTGTRARFDGMAIAGKSGTTNGSRDTWFVGYSPYVTCGAWSGYDTNETQDSSGAVKELWKAVMSRVSQYETPVAEFASVESLTNVIICSKCGQRAITGLCDQTVQGDMTVSEKFVAGTEPSGSCTCHQSVEICRTTDRMAGSYCPADQRYTKVYLISGTKGTADESYVLPARYQESCTEHTQFWDKWKGWNPFGGNSEESTEAESGTSQDNGQNPDNWNQGDKPDDGQNSDDSDNSDGKSNWWDFLFGY